MQNNLSLIGTRPLNGKMEFLSKKISNLLEENKNITLFSLNASLNYYLEYLLNEITKIDRNILKQFLNPCSNNKKRNVIFDQKLIDGIKYLLNHDLVINDNIKDTLIAGIDSIIDNIIYFIKNSESQIIIIDGIEKIDNDLEEGLIKLKKIALEKNINIILFTNLNKKWEEKQINDISVIDKYDLFDKFINNIWILDGEKLINLKDK